MESDLQSLLRNMGGQLLELAARALPELPTEFLPELPDLSDRGGVKTFHPTYTVPGPDGTRLRRVAKTWAWRFYFKNRPYQGADGYNTSAQAREAGERRKAEVRAGLEDDWRKLTVQGLHQMVAARKVTWDASTGSSFDAVWKRLFRFFKPDELVMTIDDTRVLQFVGFRKGEGAAVNTIRLDLQHLRAAMTVANRKRLLPWPPEFPTLKQERREATVAAVELSQLLAHMPDHYRLFFEAADAMGWRARSELRSRKWTHVDWGPARWTCTCGMPVADDVCACGNGRPGWVELDAASSKTDERRLFPMTRRLRSILLRARVHCERVQIATGSIVPWVFCRDDGQAIGDYRKTWNSALRRLGVGKLQGRSGPWSSAKTVHDIRRTAIRRMKAEGVERETRKALVGHASDRAHTVYEAKGGDLEALREAALRLDQAEAAGPDEKVVQLDLFRRRG